MYILEALHDGVTGGHAVLFLACLEGYHHDGIGITMVCHHDVLVDLS